MDVFIKVFYVMILGIIFVTMYYIANVEKCLRPTMLKALMICYCILGTVLYFCEEIIQLIWRLF